MENPELASIDVLHELDLAGPLAPLVILEDLLEALPPLDPNARFLSGYIAGRKGCQGMHWATLMEDGEWAAGWWAGSQPWGRA